MTASVTDHERVQEALRRFDADTVNPFMLEYERAIAGVILATGEIHTMRQASRIAVAVGAHLFGGDR